MKKPRRYVYNNDQGKKVSRQRIHQLRFPLRHYARSITQRAIKEGKLVPQPCEVCGSPLTEAHHTDYNKPLDVRWLCKQHHSNIKRMPYFTRLTQAKKSGLPLGVSRKAGHRFEASLRRNGKLVSLGRYTTPEEAHQAFLVAREKRKRLDKLN